jgi:hypothetical protein
MIEKQILDALFCECVRELEGDEDLNTKEYLFRMQGLKDLHRRIIMFLNDSELIFADCEETAH